MISRDKLALALDTPNLKQAKKLADQLDEFFGVVKIGLTLWSAEGPNAVKTLQSKGRQIFLDLKLHDIPHQVGKAATALAELNVDYVTMHTAGGKEMLAAGVAGLMSGKKPAKVLAVTILTSQATVDEKIFLERVQLARATNCGGIVCAVNEVELAKQQADIFCAVPGIRPTGTSSDDQARPGTIEDAVKAGADLLVIGRAVTQAKDPLGTTKQMFSV